MMLMNANFAEFTRSGEEKGAILTYNNKHREQGEPEHFEKGETEWIHMLTPCALTIEYAKRSLYPHNNGYGYSYHKSCIRIRYILEETGKKTAVKSPVWVVKGNGQ